MFYPVALLSSCVVVSNVCPRVVGAYDGGIWFIVPRYPGIVPGLGLLNLGYY